LRQQGDYEIHAPMGSERVREAVDKAEAFVSEIRKIVDLAP